MFVPQKLLKVTAVDTEVFQSEWAQFRRTFLNPCKNICFYFLFVLCSRTVSRLCGLYTQVCYRDFVKEWRHCHFSQSELISWRQETRALLLMVADDRQFGPKRWMFSQEAPRCADRRYSEPQISHTEWCQFLWQVCDSGLCVLCHVPLSSHSTPSISCPTAPTFLILIFTCLLFEGLANILQ